MGQNVDIDNEFSLLIKSYNNELKNKEPDVKKLLCLGIGLIDLLTDMENISSALKNAKDLTLKLKESGVNVDIQTIDIDSIDNRFFTMRKLVNISKKSFIEDIDEIFKKHHSNQHIDIFKIFKLDLDKKHKFIEIEKIDNSDQQVYYKIIIERLDNLFDAVESIKRLNTPELKPFNTKDQIKIFNYLNDKWVFKKQVRYAYIYNFMIYTLNYTIDFTTYNKFIISKYGKKVQRNNADKDSHYEQLSELMDVYDN